MRAFLRYLSSLLFKFFPLGSPFLVPWCLGVFVVKFYPLIPSIVADVGQAARSPKNPCIRRNDKLV
jgi:hypothetical protein